MISEINHSYNSTPLIVAYNNAVKVQSPLSSFIKVLFTKLEKMKFDNTKQNLEEIEVMKERINNRPGPGSDVAYDNAVKVQSPLSFFTEVLFTKLEDMKFDNAEQNIKDIEDMKKKINNRPGPCSDARGKIFLEISNRIKHNKF